MEYKIYIDNELYHHGIKGMRWGVRRYQNKDGSLTPAGEKRRAKLEGKLEKLGGKKKTAEDTNTVQPVKRKTARDMSDDELAKAITRARMEDTYNQLRPEPKPVEKHALMKQMVNDVVKPAMVNSGKRLLENSMNNVIDKLTKGKVDPNSLEALKKTYEKLDYKQKIDKILNPDKYLSEEDQTKRADRAYKAEDRAAQMEGYANAADKAAKTRESAEASRKAEADEAARAANESTSREYYNAQYSGRGGERWESGSSSTYALSVVNNFGSSSVTSLPTSSVNSGRSYADDYMNFELLDSNGGVIKRWRD